MVRPATTGTGAGGRRGFEHLRTELDQHVLTVTLNRPEVRNALHGPAYTELTAAFRGASGDDRVRCVVVTGADPAFCGGKDVKQLVAAGTPKRTRLNEPVSAVLEREIPVIAAANGPAAGWGMELAICADFRIASVQASFGLLFVKRGPVPDAGTFLRLLGIVKMARDAELKHTGEMIDPLEAERIRLVSAVVPHDRLFSEDRALALRIAANAPLAPYYVKDGLRRSGPDLEGLGTWVTAHRGLFATNDHCEGVRAFLEKCEPRFDGT